MFLLFNGRIAGVSGIVSGLLRSRFVGETWRFSFVAGLISGGLVLRELNPALIESTLTTPHFLIVVAGLLVGYGTSLGSGCTSGHGICGVGRFSSRSIVATGVFLVVGMLTATILRMLWSQS